MLVATSVFHARGLLFVDDRPQVHRTLVGISHVQTARPLGELLSIGLGDRLMDQMPADGEAHLALVKERAEGRGRSHRVEISILKDDGGILAAQFERHFLERPSGVLGHLSSGQCRSSEGDHVDVRIESQGLAGLGPAGDDAQHALGHFFQFEQPGDGIAAAHRGLEVGLQHHGIAHRQRRKDCSRGEDERSVPGRDDAHDPERDPPRIAGTGQRTRQDMADGLAGERRDLDGLAHGGYDLEGSLGRNRSGLSHNPTADLIGMSFAEARELAQCVAPRRRWQGCPSALSPLRGPGRFSHIGGIAGCSVEQNFHGGLVEDRHLAASGRLESAEVDRAGHVRRDKIGC